MQFASLFYWYFFLLIATLLWSGTRFNNRWYRNGLLLIVSYIFYGFVSTDALISRHAMLARTRLEVPITQHSQATPGWRRNEGTTRGNEGCMLSCRYILVLSLCDLGLLSLRCSLW